MRKKYDTNVIIGSIFVCVVVLFILIGIVHSPYDPNAMDGSAINQPPNIRHIFGTDHFGRDILSRVMEGAKTTFLLAVVTVTIGGVIGTLLGAFTGYYGGVLDEILMRVNDGFASFPSILLALIFVSIFGPGTYSITISLGIIFVPTFARVVRGEFLRLKSADFVKNAKLMGASNVRIMFIHILPNTKNIVLSTIVITFNNAVLAESGMSFLGLGVQPPHASLGRMLSESQTYMLNAPWTALAPGFVIILFVLGLHLINDSLRV